MQNLRSKRFIIIGGCVLFIISMLGVIGVMYLLKTPQHASKTDTPHPSSQTQDSAAAPVIAEFIAAAAKNTTISGSYPATALAKDATAVSVFAPLSESTFVEVPTQHAAQLVATMPLTQPALSQLTVAVQKVLEANGFTYDPSIRIPGVAAEFKKDTTYCSLVATPGAPQAILGCAAESDYKPVVSDVSSLLQSWPDKSTATYTSVSRTVVQSDDKKYSVASLILSDSTSGAITASLLYTKAEASNWTYVVDVAKKPTKGSGGGKAYQSEALSKIQSDPQYGPLVMRALSGSTAAR